MAWNLIYQPDPAKLVYREAAKDGTLPLQTGARVYLAQNNTNGTFSAQGAQPFTLRDKLQSANAGELYAQYLGDLGAAPFSAGSQITFTRTDASGASVQKTFRVAASDTRATGGAPAPAPAQKTAQKTARQNAPAQQNSPATVRDLAARVGGLQIEIEALRQENAKLRGAADIGVGARDADAALAALRAELSAKEREIADRKDAIRALQGEQELLQGDIDARRARIQRVREEGVQLEADIRELEESPSRKALLARKAELDALEASLADFGETRARLAADIEQASARAAELEGAAAAAKTRADALSAQCAAFDAEADEHLRALSEKIVRRLQKLQTEGGLSGSLSYIADVLTGAYADGAAGADGAGAKLGADGLPDEPIILEYRKLCADAAALNERVTDIVNQRSEAADSVAASAHSDRKA